MRYSEIPPEAMTEAQREVCTAITAGKRGRVPPPFQVLLHSPTLCARAQALGEFARYDTSLGSRLSELAILVTARHWTAQYEWYAHAKIARESELDPAIIDAIAARRDPKPLMQPDERAVYDFAKALHETHRVDDVIYAEATRLLGAQGVVDLIGVLGYYTLISMTLNTFEVPVPGGTYPLTP
jgi:4-carboxymuconolactone decarboxylase